jgi:hypothetical protein
VRLLTLVNTNVSSGMTEFTPHWTARLRERVQRLIVRMV